MTSLNRPAGLNRAVLVLVGLALIAVGAFTLLTHFGTLTVLKPESALVPGTGQPPTWALYVITAGAVVLGLLVLRWLVAQLTRKPKTYTWRFETDPDLGRTELAASTAIEPFTTEVTSYHGVHAAHATLAGTRDTPAVALVISAEQDADVSEIRRRIDTDGLPRLRQALDLDTLSVTIEFRFSTKTGARAL
ncbi:alkaline shock response membrane anchor protein AmaP [Amycolatopsis thailandensis]|uniref:Alkaline shock response membrane anchor protein AmaP n=1 Tax=Amycolatopsis thailandensis TaxID=589330 RepID=A0A229SB99_9PSEU|nr:alkaline shock response membrane anchor protein AmaP [Amycolatopsis thailandensis]OXM56095.1 alkaline shock response membrane anchor protein AmaP [Amycolatopsis thailandensis]